MLDDYDTVAEFYNSPESFIEKHNLSEGLKKALQADEDRDLADLGIGLRSLHNRHVRTPYDRRILPFDGSGKDARNRDGRLGCNIGRKTQTPHDLILS